MADGSTGARGLDRGRVVVGPLFVVLLVFNVQTFVARVEAAEDVDAAALAASLCASVLTIGFYGVGTWAYLRRGPASATTQSWPARAAAVVATLLPFTIPLTGSSGRGSVTTDVLTGLLLVLGLGWSLWSISALGRNLSIVAQVRQLVTGGPYRWVRHPLYLGELVAVLGLAVREATMLGYALWALMVGLQIYRAHHEERLLGDAFPDYEHYRSRSARLVPGVY